MYNKIKKTVIKNPATGREDRMATLEEMVRDTLYEIVVWLQNELKEPRKNMVWPRKWHVHMSNGNNELVVAKLDVQKFADVHNSGDEINKFKGIDADEVEIESDEDADGETETFPIENTPCMYLDFGYRDDEEGITASRALIVGQNSDELKTNAN